MAAIDDAPKTSRLLKPRKIGAIVHAIEKGMPPFRAAQLFRVSKNAWQDWLLANQRDRALGIQSVFTRFFDQVDQAEATYLKRILDTIDNALDQTEVRDLVLVLERRFPDEYRKRETQEVVQRRGVPMISEVLTTEADELGRAARLLALMQENKMLPEHLEIIDVVPVEVKKETV